MNQTGVASTDSRRQAFRKRDGVTNQLPTSQGRRPLISPRSLLAGCQCLLPRFARLGPLCGSQRVRNSRNEPHSGPNREWIRSCWELEIGSWEFVGSVSQVLSPAPEYEACHAPA